MYHIFLIQCRGDTRQWQKSLQAHIVWYSHYLSLPNKWEASITEHRPYGDSLSLVSSLKSDGYDLHDAFVLLLLDRRFQFQKTISVSKHYRFSSKIQRLYCINSMTKILKIPPYHACLWLWSLLRGIWTRCLMSICQLNE